MLFLSCGCVQDECLCFVRDIYLEQSEQKNKISFSISATGVPVSGNRTRPKEGRNRGSSGSNMCICCCSDTLWQAPYPPSGSSTLFGAPTLAPNIPHPTPDLSRLSGRCGKLWKPGASAPTRSPLGAAPTSGGTSTPVSSSSTPRETGEAASSRREHLLALQAASSVALRKNGKYLKRS